jgi:hypothetical protein
MSASIVCAFTDPDAFRAAIGDAQAEGIVTGRGRFHAELTRIRLGRLSLQRSEESLARVSYSAISPAIAGFVFPTAAGPPTRANGLETAMGDVVAYRPGSTGYDRSTAACRWGAVALPCEALGLAGEALIGREPFAPSITAMRHAATGLPDAAPEPASGRRRSRQGRS